jgi:hypothetical protein
MLRFIFKLLPKMEEFKFKSTEMYMVQCMEASNMWRIKSLYNAQRLVLKVYIDINYLHKLCMLNEYIKTHYIAGR